MITMYVYVCVCRYISTGTDFFFQVPKIAAAFGLQLPLHLMKDIDNTVFFPCGIFNPSVLSPGCTYEVHRTGTGTQRPGDEATHVACCR